MVQSFSEKRINNYLRLLCAPRLFVGVTFRGAILWLQDIPRSLLYRPYPTFHSLLQRGTGFYSRLSFHSPLPSYRVLPGLSAAYISLRLLLFFVSAPPRASSTTNWDAREEAFRLFPYALSVSLSILPLLFYGNSKHLGLELWSRRKMSLECAHDSLSLYPAVMLAK